MKRKLEENEDYGGPPLHSYVARQHYGGWQPRGHGNMHSGGGQGFRGGRGSPWRDTRTPNNQNFGSPGYYYGNRERGGPGRYPVDNSQYNQWHQQQFPYENHHHHHHHQYVENGPCDMDSLGGNIALGGNYAPGPGAATYSWAERRYYKNMKGNCNSGSSSNGARNGTSSSSNIVIVEKAYDKTKLKRRPMSENYPSRPWNREDAKRALAVEKSHMRAMKNDSLIIRFPDPELTKDLVKNLIPGIETVHFQGPSCPRYCFVQLSENVDPDSVTEHLSKIKFGSGKLMVEKKYTREKDDPKPETIDPYTLYVGNLPTNVNVATVKSKFPTASRVDVGYAQKVKFTRYAFIRFTSVDDAIAAFKQNHDMLIESRSLIIRFRRIRGPNEAQSHKSRKNAAENQQKKKDGTVSKEPEKNKDENSSDDNEDDDDDSEDIVDDDDDDSDDDDDDSDDFDDDDDDEEDDMGPDALDDDDPDDNVDDEEDDYVNDDDDDDDDEGLSRQVFEQIDAQIQDMDETFQHASNANK